jgi:hypothetical protein
MCAVNNYESRGICCLMIICISVRAMWWWWWGGCGHTVAARHFVVIIFFSSSMGWSHTPKNLRTSCRLPSTLHRTRTLRPSDCIIYFVTSSAIHFFSVYSSLIYLYILAFLSHYFPSHFSILASSFLSLPYLKAEYQPHCATCYVKFSRMSASFVTAHK